MDEKSIDSKSIYIKGDAKNGKIFSFESLIGRNTSMLLPKFI